MCVSVIIRLISRGGPRIKWKYHTERYEWILGRFMPSGTGKMWLDCATCSVLITERAEVQRQTYITMFPGPGQLPVTSWGLTPGGTCKYLNSMFEDFWCASYKITFSAQTQYGSTLHNLWPLVALKTSVFRCYFRSCVTSTWRHSEAICWHAPNCRCGDEAGSCFGCCRRQLMRLSLTFPCCRFNCLLFSSDVTPLRRTLRKSSRSVVKWITSRLFCW